VGKSLAHSNTARAAVIAGGTTAASGAVSVAEYLWTAREVVSTTGDIADRSGFPFLTVALAVIAVVAVGYIIYDRWFKSKYEGV
jgi:hypothetical protein